MRISYDPTKNAKNVSERGLSFERVVELDWHSAIAVEDTRQDYGERRFRIMGTIEQRLYVAVITYREDVLHVISFRKANRREVKWYAETRKADA